MIISCDLLSQWNSLMSNYKYAICLQFLCESNFVFFHVELVHFNNGVEQHAVVDWLRHSLQKDGSHACMCMPINQSLQQIHVLVLIRNIYKKCNRINLEKYSCWEKLKYLTKKIIQSWNYMACAAFVNITSLIKKHIQKWEATYLFCIKITIIYVYIALINRLIWFYISFVLQ